MIKEILQKNGARALFLPDGSVRSIIALLLVLAYIIAVFVAMLKGLDSPGDLKEAMLLVVGFYFMRKAAAAVQK